MKDLVRHQPQQITGFNKGKGLSSRGLSALRNVRSKDEAEALYQQGLIFYEAENYEKALECFLSAVEQGYANAQLALGDMYKFGRGVKQDFEHALACCRRAAEQGHLDAQYRLGCTYDRHIYYRYSGDGLYLLEMTDSTDHEFCDDDLAFFWYSKAADQGHSVAQLNLGDAYYWGHGVKQNYELSVYWYSKSAKQGHDYAQFHLGESFSSGEGVEQDEKQAFYWYTKAAEQGNGEACYCLAGMYADGMGCQQNFRLAVYWYLESIYWDMKNHQHRVLPYQRYRISESISQLTDINFKFYENCFSVVDGIRENGYIKSIYVFGSRSKGNYTVDSDLDLAVELNYPPRSRHKEFPVCDSCDALMHTLTEWLYEKLSKHGVTLDINCYCNSDESPTIKTALAESSILIYRNEVLQN